MIDLVDLVPFALLGAVLGMDVVTFPQAMISRPIVASTVAGAFAGDPYAGLVIGALLELLALEMLPFGASRYPEWGSASVVGGALFAAERSGSAGALAAALLAALVTALVSGRSMVWIRRLNASRATRVRAELDRGSRRAVTGLQLSGLASDLVRGFAVTLAALLAFSSLAPMVARTWGADARYTRAAIVALVAAVAVGAVWKLFHGVPRARVLLLGGLAAGVVMLVSI